MPGRGIERLIPVSKATNSDELLVEVIDVVRAEPLRLNMDDVICSLPGDGGYFTSDGNLGLRPACGTVACVAGWINVMRHQLSAVKSNNDDSRRLTLLGPAYDNFPAVTRDRLHDLFHTFPQDEGSYDAFGVFHSLKLKHGTPAYVEFIIARIEKLRADFKEQLLDFTLTPPTFTRGQA